MTATYGNGTSRGRRLRDDELTEAPISKGIVPSSAMPLKPQAPQTPKLKKAGAVGPTATAQTATVGKRADYISKGVNLKMLRGGRKAAKVATEAKGWRAVTHESGQLAGGKLNTAHQPFAAPGSKTAAGWHSPAAAPAAHAPATGGWHTPAPMAPKPGTGPRGVVAPPKGWGSVDKRARYYDPEDRRQQRRGAAVGATAATAGFAATRGFGFEHGKGVPHTGEKARVGLVRGNRSVSVALRGERVGMVHMRNPKALGIGALAGGGALVINRSNRGSGNKRWR